MKRVLVTGCNGLIGSTSVAYFAARGWAVTGLDNSARREFFGADGDTTHNVRRLRGVDGFDYREADIRDRDGMRRLVAELRPAFVIHCAAQPSHERSADRPFESFDVNALGTVNLLEAVRSEAPEAPFCFLSSNKVYGDAPNRLPLVEKPTRWDYADPAQFDGIDEHLSIDQSLHSPFGASKVAADVFVQEYGRYYGVPTVSFRGGCLTGPNQAAAEMHGFLGYLVKCCRIGRPYRIYGFKGKQVRDNIHAEDVCRAMEAFATAPRPGEVYNLGGGRANSVSILEAIALAEEATGRVMQTSYDDTARPGDHICYITNLGKLRAHYPGWALRHGIVEIVRELAALPA